MNPVDLAHERFVHDRRVQVLCRHLGELMPRDARVLDVGCGDGLLAARIMAARPDVTIEGIDVLVRDATHVPVKPYDGRRIPADDGAFDVVMSVDVIHHADDPRALLAEIARVARDAVLIKDHLVSGLFAHATLRFMDYVGNARHGVALPYQYWTPGEWERALAELDLRPRAWRTQLGLYPFPASLLFDRALHFIALLETPRPAHDRSGTPAPPP